jgi:hypothetical protein
MFQILITGLCLSLSTPLCCALFPQKAAISLDKLEPELQQKLKKQYPDQNTFYFNKGL